MNVELIKMDKAEAREKLREYRRAIAVRYHSAAARKATAEYEAIANAYKVAARGLPLIELSKAMATGGWDEVGRPRFAVAAADRKTVAARTNGSDLVFYDPLAGSAYRRSRLRHRFDMRKMPPRPQGAKDFWELRAIVPLIPADVLPRPDIDLSRRVILWEADWKEAPVDPLLLLPIGGDLYVVEAAWNLTALERAVIAGRGQ